MKNKYLSFLFAIVCLSIHVQNASAENGPVSYTNEQLRHIFSEINHPTNFLYDRAAHIIDEAYYSTMCTIPTNYAIWYLAYEEMYNAAKNQNLLRPVSSIVDIAYRYESDTIAVGIMDWQYSRLNPNVLSDDTYFDFDTIHNKLSRGNRVNNPYYLGEIFMVAPLVEATHTTHPIFCFDSTTFAPSLIDHPDISTYVDFGDGSGEHLIQLDHTPVYIDIEYDEAGTYQMVTKVYNIVNNQRILLKKSISDISVEDNLTIGSLEDLGVHTKQITRWTEEGMRVFEFTSDCKHEPEEEKIIFVLSGYNPFSFQNFFKRTPADLYKKYILEGNMHNLPAFGYKFVVVDWLYPNQDIRMNAERFYHLLNDYICEAENDEQFVVIGHSMGCLIGRYTLTAMESIWTHDCHPEKLHNTRLFISNDGPHQGVNIPMSLQRIVANLLSEEGELRGLTDFMSAVTCKQVDFTKTLLEGTSVKQMLNRHYSTGINGIYTPAYEHYDFFTALNNIGNYPQYCKLVALSNGSLEGANQQNVYYDEDTDTYIGYNSSFRTPNDHIFTMENHLRFRVLGLSFGSDYAFNIYSNPEGCGHLYEIDDVTYKPELHLYWFGIRVDTIYEDNSYNLDGCGLRPYCVSPGGQEYLPRHKSILQDPWHFFANLGFLGIDFEINPGTTFAVGLNVGIPWLLDISEELYLHTDGMGFGFVPIGSAFDYDLSNNLNVNFTTQNPADIMSHTPFDVLIGRVSVEPEIAYNGNHEDVLNPPLMDSGNGDIRYDFCNPMRKCLLNGEIGDDELYLDCNHLFWNTQYSAYKTIHHGQTPFYSYVNPVNTIDSTMTQFHPTVGAISRMCDQSYVSSANIVEYCNYPIDYIFYEGEYHGILCCFPYETIENGHLRNSDNDDIDNDIDNFDNEIKDFQITPSIINTGTSVLLHAPYSDVWTLRISSMYGIRYYDGVFNGESFTLNIPSSWNSGTYFVSAISQSGEYFSAKFLVTKFF